MDFIAFTHLTLLFMLLKRLPRWPLVAAWLLLLAACGGSEGQEGRRGFGGEGTIPSVEVIQARNGSLPLQERLSGTVKADNQVAIYPEIAASVMKVTAQNGDYVRQGQPLVYLRDTQFRDQLRQAEATLQINQAEAKRAAANLRELKGRLDRTKGLAEKQLQSQQELETLQAQYDAAEATHEQALGRIAQAEATISEQQEALRRAVVRAPISGVVGQRNVEVGMRVDTGTHLYTIGNFDIVRVVVSITDEMINRIQVGQTALIGLEEQGDQVIRAEVSRISPFLEAGSYSAAAEIDVPNDDGTLRPGMFVTVDVLYGESEQATLLPTSALYENTNTGALGVYIAESLGSETPLREPTSYDEDNPPPMTEPTPMTFKEVTVLARGGGLVGVDVVQPGDWVVTVGQNLLGSTTGDGPVDARARPMTWDRVATLQGLQDQDLLRQFMEKQQRLARETSDAQEAADTAAEETPASLSNAPRP